MALDLTVDGEELDDLKAYMRVDTEEDNAVISALGYAAKIYLLQAGIAPSESELYRLAFWGLTLHYYEHRSAVAAGAAEFPIGLRPIINQLKLFEGAREAANEGD